MEQWLRVKMPRKGCYVMSANSESFCFLVMRRTSLNATYITVIFDLKKSPLRSDGYCAVKHVCVCMNM